MTTFRTHPDHAVVHFDAELTWEAATDLVDVVVPHAVPARALPVAPIFSRPLHARVPHFLRAFRGFARTLCASVFPPSVRATPLHFACAFVGVPARGWTRFRSCGVLLRVLVPAYALRLKHSTRGYSGGTRMMAIDFVATHPACMQWFRSSSALLADGVAGVPLFAVLCWAPASARSRLRP